jgi:hypothetical protein
MDPIMPASTPNSDSASQPDPVINAAPSPVPTSRLPAKFAPEPIPYMASLPTDSYTPPSPQPESQTGTNVSIWPAPIFYSPFFVPTPEQFQHNTGQRMPGISYGSDALWLEGQEEARRRQAAPCER